MRDLLVGLDEFGILQEIPKEFNAFHVRVGILRHVTAVERFIDESRITAEGCGTTKDKYETYENNRVAMLFFEK